MPVPVVKKELPLIALVGRPNVGKSTLWNRLVGGHHAIVEDQPGVTRDRRYGETDYDGVAFRVVDTGGLDLAADGALAQSVQRQSMRAVDEAALLLLVLDGQVGLTPEDRAVASKLRRTGKPLIFVANKVDGDRHEAGLGDFYALGADDVFGISAAHGRGLPDLLSAIADRLRPESTVAEHHALPDAELDDGSEPLASPDGEGEEDAQVDLENALVRIALVGRPNAGKSSLINALCGEERMIVDSTPGTTRDPVDTLIEHQGKQYLLIDTAGIRRRAKVYEPMEKVAVAMAEKAVNRADIAILVIDAEAGIGEQDAKIAGLVQDAGRALIILWNKRDLVDERQLRKLSEDRQRLLQFVPWALELSCSARTGKGVVRLLNEARRIYQSYARRVSTGALNRFFEGIVERHPPPLYLGKPIKLYYITQAQAKPPTFIVSVNYTEGMHFSYQRYLQNQLRETFAFEGTPVRIVARARSRSRT